MKMHVLRLPHDTNDIPLLDVEILPKIGQSEMIHKFLEVLYTLLYIATANGASIGFNTSHLSASISLILPKSY